MDANSKIGPDNLPNDPHVQTPNGRLLMDLVNDNDLIVANSTSKCDGLITRRRKVLDKVEESAIDFFITCPAFYSLIERMSIDEKHIYSLGSFFQRDGLAKFVESDHNVLFLDLNLSLQFNVKEKSNRVEVYNYKNEEDFKQFVETTNTDSSLIDCFDAAIGDINDQCNL